MNVGDIVVENGSEYEILLDKSTESLERYTLGLKNGTLHKTGDSFIIEIQRFKIIYSTQSSNRITITKSK